MDLQPLSRIQREVQKLAQNIKMTAIFVGIQRVPSFYTFTFVAKYQLSYLSAYLCSLSIGLLCGDIYIEYIMEKYKYLKFDELDVDATTWVKEILQMVQCQFVGQVSASSLSARRDLTKDMLAKKLSNVLNIINRQNEYM